MGMTCSDDEAAIMRDHALRQKLDELADVLSRRPNVWEGAHESEDSAAIREHYEMDKLREVAELYHQREAAYWANDRR